MPRTASAGHSAGVAPLRHVRDDSDELWNEKGGMHLEVEPKKNSCARMPCVVRYPGPAGSQSKTGNLFIEDKNNRAATAAKTSTGSGWSPGMYADGGMYCFGSIVSACDIVQG